METILVHRGGVHAWAAAPEPATPDAALGAPAFLSPDPRRHCAVATHAKDATSEAAGMRGLHRAGAAPQAAASEAAGLQATGESAGRCRHGPPRGQSGRGGVHARAAAPEPTTPDAALGAPALLIPDPRRRRRTVAAHAKAVAPEAASLHGLRSAGAVPKAAVWEAAGPEAPQLQPDGEWWGGTDTGPHVARVGAGPARWLPPPSLSALATG